MPISSIRSTGLEGHFINRTNNLCFIWRERLTLHDNLNKVRGPPLTIKLPHHHVKEGGGPMTDLLQALGELVIQPWFIYLAIIGIASYLTKKLR